MAKQNAKILYPERDKELIPVPETQQFGDLLSAVNTPLSIVRITVTLQVDTSFERALIPPDITKKYGLEIVLFDEATRAAKSAGMTPSSTAPPPIVQSGFQ